MHRKCISNHKYDSLLLDWRDYDNAAQTNPLLRPVFEEANNPLHSICPISGEVLEARPSQPLVSAVTTQPKLHKTLAKQLHQPSNLCADASIFNCNVTDFCRRPDQVRSSVSLKRMHSLVRKFINSRTIACLKAKSCNKEQGLIRFRNNMVSTYFSFSIRSYFGASYSRLSGFYAAPQGVKGLIH